MGITPGWKNHPATGMWKGYERLLADYGVAVCNEWARRGYKDSLMPKFLLLRSVLPVTGRPFWLGVREFHRSHRSNLKRKDPRHYRFRVPVDLPYLWPDNATNRFTVGRGSQRRHKGGVGA